VLRFSIITQSTDPAVSVDTGSVLEITRNRDRFGRLAPTRKPPESAESVSTASSLKLFFR
jgi:hypothetical protein